MNKIEELHHEIAELLSNVDDVWILEQVKQFIIGMTREG